MKRWIYGWILSVIGFLIVLIPACKEFSKVAEKSREVADYVVDKGKESGLLKPLDSGQQAMPGSGVHSVSYTKPILDRNQSEIVIGSLNIQTFGVTKIANAKVMATLVDVARQFDVLAIQEIRSKHDQTILDQYVAMINADGGQYSYVISSLLGSGRYFEQYAFIYDTRRIELIDKGFVVPDPNDYMHREPMVAQFRTRTPDPNAAFTFAIANVHIDPDQWYAELKTLYHMLIWMKSYLYQAKGEDDVIVVGDLNAPPRKYGDLWQIQTLGAALSDHITTNTAQTKSLDNILFDSAYTQEYTGKSGVIDLEGHFGLTRREAQAVSDHLPVWASFSATEFKVNPDQFANQPGQRQR